VTETSEKLDILYAGTLPPHNGGTAIVGYQLLAGLARRGHTIRAIAPITSETLAAGDEFSRRHAEIGIRRYLIPYFNSSPDQPMSCEFQDAETSVIVRAFETAISERRPDLLIIGRETFAWRLPELAVGENIPSMLLVQGSGLFGMKHSFPTADRDRLVQQFGKVDSIVAVARHLVASMRELGLPHPEVIVNPVDSLQFLPAPKDVRLMESLGIAADQFIIAHISNLKPIKRTSDLVASAREVIRIQQRTIYLVVGDGICREQMEAECRRLGIVEHFRFTGWVDHEEVSDYINLADVIVMPSQSEAMALVYLETMACGRLLIASDIPAAREVVRDGETGLLFRMGDIEDLTRKILLAANDPALREGIGRTGRACLKEYDLNKFAASYERAIFEVVRKRRTVV
jgi:glycosyltransferase involved in cell wall biosynthesis